MAHFPESVIEAFRGAFPLADALAALSEADLEAVERAVSSAAGKSPFEKGIEDNLPDDELSALFEIDLFLRQLQAPVAAERASRIRQAMVERIESLGHLPDETARSSARHRRSAI